MHSPESRLELLETVNNQQALINATRDMMWSVDKEYRLISANQSYHVFVEKIIGHTFRPGDLVLVDKKTGEWNTEWKMLFDRAFTGESFSVELDSMKEQFTHFNPIFNSSFNTIIGVACHSTNIADRNKRDKEREQLINELIRSNTDLKQFSFITSHNLRAPLSNITGLLAFLEMDTLDPANKEVMELIGSAAEKLSETIRDLTNILVIKNTTVPTGSLDIEQVFHTVNRNFLQTERNIGAIIELDFKVSPINFNESYLESIFINLISNAIKYRHQERTLHITVSTSYSGKRTLLSFSDNGLGIDLARHNTRLFGMYQRFHPNTEGQGLGLFIIKSQIDALGGSVEIKSKVQEGTQFLITLP